MIKKIIELFLHKISKGIYKCPYCFSRNKVFTARSNFFFDKKKLYFYIKCPMCNHTSPGFDTLEEAEDYWEDLIVRGR